MILTRFSVCTATLAVLATLCRVDDVYADEAPRVAVVVSLSVNADADQSARLATALANVLEDKFVIAALGGAEIDKKLPDGVPDDCIASAECVRTLARQLKVEQLLLLTIVRVGERFKVSVTWGDGRDGRTVSRVTIDIDVKQQDPGPVFAVYATRLLPEATARPRDSAAGDGQDGPPAGTGAQGPADVVVPPVGVRTQRRHMTTGAWIATATSATFLAAGLGFGLAARSQYGSLSEMNCEALSCPEEDIDKLAFRAAAADVLLGAAVVSGVTAALLYWRSGGRVSVGDTEVAAYTTGREFAIAVGGRF